MQVQASSILLGASHAALESLKVTERLEIRRSVATTAARSLSPAPDPTSTLDPRTRMIALLYEYMTGRKARIFFPSVASNGAAGPSWGVSYSRQEVHSEAETTTFHAEGTMKLKSGAEISFSLDLGMNRHSTQIEGVTFRAGNMADPLVLNLDGLGARLSGAKTSFDLNGDGRNELIATLAAGSAWLAKDANGNGKVDSGKELLGPASGDGFAELASLDSDQNGWIDESDGAYSQMGVLQDGQFTSLKDAGIGALATSAVATPFAEKEGTQLLGAVRSSSIYLTEDGKPGALQQVDLSI